MKFKFIALFALLTVFLVACNNDRTDDPVPTSEKNIWDNAPITFSKADDADPTLAENQDRISDNVWLTRGNDGGQIFNINVESGPNKSNSPSGTKWAIGTLAQIDNLDFKALRDAIKPREIVGKDLVLFLEKDNAYLSVKFTAWSMNKGGGFTYTRSTE